ncbi:MAG: adenylate/guanylate cyclase domain-containing protein [Ignavibacterium sp.]|nr:MAG: adenylate/guanylate cyclase domain-containing protein [Ignavibacterium sp.]
MSPTLLRKLKILSIICFFSILVGILYQRLNEGFIDHSAFIVGLSLGVSLGIFELFLMRKFDSYIKNYPLLLVVLLKASIYTLFIFLISSSLAILAGSLGGKRIEEMYEYLFSSSQLYLIIYSLTFLAIVIYFLQISRLLGEGVLFKFLFGKYYKPVVEERIFMFLDLKSSTTTAEKIGHEKYYAFINSFFNDITDPVLNAKAEIYQYVGDEVVLTWKTKIGIQNANCITVFYSIKKKVEENKEDYLKKYGVVPRFKAGLHFGKVITGQVGDIKREIVYNGDVLNTTSRIQALCNEYNHDFLISGSLLSLISIPVHLEQQSLGKVKLKGKKDEIEIYALNNLEE